MSGLGISSAKYQSKKLKASGLQKLKFYCQLCQKQCRDANGFKNHLSSPSHQGRLEAISLDPKVGAVNKFSQQFEADFLRLLKMTHGTKKINANRFYQEYISNDRDHIHMNATRWRSLTAFIKYLGQNGLVKVEKDGEDDELSMSIAYIDRTSPMSIDKDKVKKAHTDDEMTKKIIQKQLEKAKERELNDAMHNVTNNNKNNNNNDNNDNNDNEDNEDNEDNNKITNNELTSLPSCINEPLKLEVSLKKTTPKLSAFNESDSDNSDSENCGTTSSKPKLNKIGKISARIFRK